MFFRQSASTTSKSEKARGFCTALYFSTKHNPSWAERGSQATVTLMQQQVRQRAASPQRLRGRGTLPRHLPAHAAGTGCRSARGGGGRQNPQASALRSGERTQLSQALTRRRLSARRARGTGCSRPTAGPPGATRHWAAPHPAAGRRDRGQPGTSFQRGCKPSHGTSQLLRRRWS